MTLRVEVAPALLRWACERVGWTAEDAAAKFAKFPDWIAIDPSARALPTLKQLESFAQATHTPIGYLFLSEPPVEEVPIPDCRTIRDAGVRRPSPDLLETIYLCQQRQAWYREHARTQGERALSFVGSARAGSDPVSVANTMRSQLGFDVTARKNLRSWTEAFRLFVSQAESLGVLVMVSGIVGAHTRRVLDPEEFRGFALVDELAPVIFVNGADTKAAQMFTLAHELAHVWRGESALSDVSAAAEPSLEVERWCNAVAAELLVPSHALKEACDRRTDAAEQVQRLARHFKVSTLVIVRRLRDAGFYSHERMWALYRQESKRLEALAAKSAGGGDYYNSQVARVSRRFAEALYVSTWEGGASFTEAMRLLNVKKIDTFEKFGRSLRPDFAGFGTLGAE